MPRTHRLPGVGSRRHIRIPDVTDPARRAVTTNFDCDAKPSPFFYNRVGSMTQVVETLLTSITRTTTVSRYDCLPRSSGERQLPENLTIALTEGSIIISVQQVRYRYDANGQRISKWLSGSSRTERYVRDGMRLIGVFDENDNLKSWNLGGAAGLVGRADPDPLGVPIRSYYVTDHLGSIRAVVRPSGTVIEGRDYYPYGLTMPGRFYVQADTTREGFTGYEQDPETRQYYAGARFYNSALARWFVIDAMAERGPGISPYVYSFNNPISFFDPDGAWPFTFNIRSFHPGVMFGTPFTSFGDARSFSTRTLGVSSRVAQQFTVETSDGRISGRSTVSSQTDQIVFAGGGPKIFSATSSPAGEITSAFVSGTTQVNAWYRGEQAVMSQVPLIGGLTPAIDVRTNLSVTEVNGGITISGTLAGDSFPNHEVFVTDAAGNSIFLLQHSKSRAGHPLWSLPGRGGPLGRFNIRVVLGEDGNFRQAFSVDGDGNETELMIHRREENQ